LSLASVMGPPCCQEDGTTWLCESASRLASFGVNAGSPAGVSLAVGRALDDEGVRAGSEAVDRGLGEQRVAHQRQPLRRLPVGGHDRGRSPVPVDHELVEVVGLGRVEGFEREVVELCGVPHSSTYAEPATMPRMMACWPRVHGSRVERLGIVTGLG
jgi:hypothetical protein